ncbi:MAG: hypothetical protein R3F04_09860 [Lysobacteraceae bacterium]
MSALVRRLQFDGSVQQAERRLGKTRCGAFIGLRLGQIHQHIGLVRCQPPCLGEGAQGIGEAFTGKLRPAASSLPDRRVMPPGVLLSGTHGFGHAHLRLSPLLTGDPPFRVQRVRLTGMPIAKQCASLTAQAKDRRPTTAAREVMRSSLATRVLRVANSVSLSTPAWRASRKARVAELRWGRSV